LSIQLVVKHPFASYSIGDHIVDPALVAQFGASHPECVVRKALEESVSSPSSTSSPASPTVPTLKPIVA
jgi:hypothetical protein